MISDALFLLILFIVFLILFRKLLKIIINSVYIILASIAFPLFVVKFLGIPLQLNMSTFIFFITSGLFLYFVYLLYSSIYMLLNFIEAFISKVMLKEYRKEKILKEVIKKYKKEKS